jgi:N-acetylmuramoyl-L-alanine amidase
MAGNKLTDGLTFSLIVTTIIVGFFTALGGSMYNKINKYIDQDYYIDSLNVDTFDLMDFKPQRIENLFIHCTATKTDWTKERLLSFFKNDRKWSKPGYHYYIRKDGSIETLVELNDDDLLDMNEIAFGASGWNNRSIHIAYSGGIDKDGKSLDTRTDAQKKSLEVLVRMFKYRYPWINIKGHREVTAKACPSFDVSSDFSFLKNYTCKL